MKKLFVTLICSFLLSGISLAQSASPDTKEAETNDNYYKNATMVFAADVDMEKKEPINPNNLFIRKDGTVKVTIVLKMDKPFKTDKIKIELYDPFYNYVAGYDTNVDENSKFISFALSFKQSEQLIVGLYTNDNVFITSATLEIW